MQTLNINQFRGLISVLLAVTVTFALFLIMFKLISSGASTDSRLSVITGIHFGPIQIPDEVITRSRRIPKKPPPLQDLPPRPKMRVIQTEEMVPKIPRLDVPELDVPLSSGTGIYIGNFSAVDKTTEGDIIPIVVIRPMYPRDAAMKGQEGWVKVKFTITAIGTVIKPSVVDANPPRVFNREAIRAILKWKFKPRVVDGIAVEREATQTIEFSLDQSGV